MNHHPTLPLSGLSRRSVVGRATAVGAALVLGSRLGRALAQGATPPAGPVEFLWETRGDPDSPLGNPSHLAVAPDGTIWVADGDNNRFQIFAPDGSLLEVWGTSGSGEGEFDFTTSAGAATTRRRSPSPRTAPSTSPISATTASRSSARTGAS